MRAWKPSPADALHPTGPATPRPGTPPRGSTTPLAPPSPLSAEVLVLPASLLQESNRHPGL